MCFPLCLHDFGTKHNENQIDNISSMHQLCLRVVFVCECVKLLANAPAPLHLISVWARQGPLLLHREGGVLRSRPMAAFHHRGVNMLRCFLTNQRRHVPVHLVINVTGSGLLVVPENERATTKSFKNYILDPPVLYPLFQISYF